MSKNVQTITLENFVHQFKELEKQVELDDKTDGIIETSQLPMFLENIGYRVGEEDLAALILKLDSEEKKEILLWDLINALRDFLDTNGSKLELLEAFCVFDEENKREISLFDFRLIMKKYAGISDEDLDGLLIDIFEVKKLSQIDTNAKVDYIQFCDKLYNEE